MEKIPNDRIKKKKQLWKQSYGLKEYRIMY